MKKVISLFMLVALLAVSNAFALDEGYYFLWGIPFGISPEELCKLTIEQRGIEFRRSTDRYWTNETDVIIYEHPASIWAVFHDDLRLGEMSINFDEIETERSTAIEAGLNLLSVAVERYCEQLGDPTSTAMFITKEKDSKHEYYAVPMLEHSIDKTLLSKIASNNYEISTLVKWNNITIQFWVEPSGYKRSEAQVVIFFRDNYEVVKTQPRPYVPES